MRNQLSTAERMNFRPGILRTATVTQSENEAQLVQRRLDEMLNEALIDSFPASDPISSLRLA